MEKEGDYVEYIPVAKRRAMEAHKILFGLEEKSDKLLPKPTPISKTTPYKVLHTSWKPNSVA
ncbi:hypothetical protein Pyn_01402 [Prunus yedoensis var. nudiflora]|uniref:Uncharacterized protein n=1 Tax=Prunus yedoensis var. nudiflora TaxID=2094558 RepID=A0A314YXX0_PRUYE|nr:hypothetical protein Pyn_01402 [Prunus yedoensis var. nudiflora]